MRRIPTNYVLCIGLTPALQEIREFTGLRPGMVNRAQSVVRCPGGKGVNVAHVLATLGTPVALVGFIGGYTGEEIRRDLDRFGVHDELVEVSAPTRVCHTLIDRATGEVTELVEESSRPSRAEWRAFQQKFRRLLPAAKLVTISGTLIPGIGAGLYRDLARRARACGVPVLIDSQGPPLLEALECRPLLAKLNAAELANTVGARTSSVANPVAGARRLLRAGAQQVLVTQGEQGAWLVGAECAWHWQPPPIAVCNPIGSGDAVTAGIAHGLLKQMEMADAVRLGIACGTANALTPTPGTVRRRDVRALAPRIVCRAV